MVHQRGATSAALMGERRLAFASSNSPPERGGPDESDDEAARARQPEATDFPESRLGRDRGAIGERPRSGWSSPFGGCLIVSRARLALPAASSSQPAAVEAI